MRIVQVVGGVRDDDNIDDAVDESENEGEVEFCARICKAPQIMTRAVRQAQAPRGKAGTPPISYTVQGSCYPILVVDIIQTDSVILLYTSYNSSGKLHLTLNNLP